MGNSSREGEVARLVDAELVTLTGKGFALCLLDRFSFAISFALLFSGETGMSFGLGKGTDASGRGESAECLEEELIGAERRVGSIM